jgi:hypothetical protein
VFAALENLSVSEGINRDWENNKENIKTSAEESSRSNHGLIKSVHNF